MSFFVNDRFAYGKYEGEAAAEVARRDPGYIRWAWDSRENLALSIDEESVVMDILSPQEDPAASSLTMVPPPPLPLNGLAERRQKWPTPPPPPTPRFEPRIIRDEAAWTHWPKVWGEDDATTEDPDHEDVYDAWCVRYGEAFNRENAIETFDDGDCVCYLMAGGRVLEASYPGNSRILECPPPLPPFPLAQALVPAPYIETVEGVVDEVPLPPPPVPSPWVLLNKSRVSFNWNDGQRSALDKIDRWSRGSDTFFALTGPAGTGKSTLLREVAERFSDATLTAMTGKAALRLAQLTDCETSTLHAKMYYPPKPGQGMKFTSLRETPDGDVLIDEASMMTPLVFRDLGRWGVRAILIGDPYQLPPVITGEELQELGDDYSVFAHVAGVELTEVMRNAGGVLRAATQVRETGRLCEQSDMDAVDEGYEYVRERSPIERAVDEFCNEPLDHLLITWSNRNRMRANALVRERINREGPLPDDGEPVLLKRNGQGHLNGEIVECGGFETGPTLGGSVRTLWMRIGKPSAMQEKILVSVDGGNREKGGEFFDGQMPWIENWKKYHAETKAMVLPDPTPISWGYCLTCHSAQGSEAKRVTVFLERGDVRSSNFRKLTTLPSGESAPFSARWVYTATTRGKRRATMIVGR